MRIALAVSLLILLSSPAVDAPSGETDITVRELKEMLSGPKDFFLLDVHIPEQKHLRGTDAFLPYNELERRWDRLPSDRDRLIVVYCRSGSMSSEVVGRLRRMGYRRAYNLAGGVLAWKEAGLPVDGPDRILHLTVQGGNFDPDTITARVGERIALVAESREGGLEFALPDYDGKAVVGRGERARIEFTADKKGEFVFTGSSEWPSGRYSARGRLIVE